MLGVTNGDLLGLAGVYGYVITIFVVAQLLKGRARNQRKIVHILTGGIVFFWWSFDTQVIMAGLAAFPFVILLLLATPRSPIEFLRDGVLGARSSEGHPYGLVLYAISWTALAFFLFDDLLAASIAISAMAFGDGTGDLVGRRFGRLRYMQNRTLEGSSAVFSATAVSILVLSWFYFDIIGYSGGSLPEILPLFAVVIGALVALIEAITPGAIDNLVIPLAIGGFLHILGV